MLLLTKYGGHVCWFQGIVTPERVLFKANILFL